jgi:hypothetical protein
MDMSTVLLPGAQNLASAMLTDAWSAIRGVIARKWARGDETSTSRMETELDAVRADAIAVSQAAGSDANSSSGQRQRELAFYWAGYLRRLLEERPDLAEVIASLPAADMQGHTTVSVERGSAQVVHGDVHGAAISVERLEGGINVSNRR